MSMSGGSPGAGMYRVPGEWTYVECKKCKKKGRSRGNPWLKPCPSCGADPKHIKAVREKDGSKDMFK